MDDFLYNLRRESDKRNRRQTGQQQYRGPDRRGPKDPRRGFPRRNEAADQQLQDTLATIVPEIKMLLEAFGENQKQLLANDTRKTRVLEDIAASLRALSGKQSPLEIEAEIPAPVKQFMDDDPEVFEASEEAIEVVPEEAASFEDDADQLEEKPLRSTHEEVRKIALSLREQGKTYKEIAQYLDDEKIPTFSGKGGWHAPTIHKLCK